MKDFSVVATSIQNWLTTVVIGFFVVSYWRGTWTLFDMWLCDMPTNSSLLWGETFCYAAIPDEWAGRAESGWISYAIGMGLTVVGVTFMWMGVWRPPVKGVDQVQLPPLTVVLRFVTVYILGMAAVNIWRGVWYLTDYYLLPNTLTDNGQGLWPLTSFWVSSVVGSTACFLCCAGASILAPPAIFLLDGPGVNPPPLAVTVLSSYYSLTMPAAVGARAQSPPEIQVPAYMIALDVIGSFVFVPIMVVWYWRGSWLLLDYYLWTFSLEEQDLHKSMAWSLILAMFLMFSTSETVVGSIQFENKTVMGLLGRLRTYLLAWGTVNFWRVVWYIWDEFLGGPTNASCWISHVLSLAVLTAMGCVSCIVAPASTIGVDFMAHPDAAFEPLFSNLPAPMADLFVLAIGRQPQTVDEKTVPKGTIVQRDQFVKMSLAASRSGSINFPPLIEATIEEETSDEGTGKDGTIELQQQSQSEPLPQTSDDDGGMSAEILPASVIAMVQSSQQFWRSSGTGRHPSYSSSRMQSEELRRSYLDMQRPDMDRRVGARQLSRSLQAAGVSPPPTLTSSFTRSR